MRIRYFSFLTLGVSAAFLVVISQAFAAVDIANVSLGVAIGMLALSLAVVARHRQHVPSLAAGIAVAAVSAWMIVSSQVFSAETVQNLTFAEALAIAGLALTGLTAHELGTERVVHSLETEAGTRNSGRPHEFAL
jgi:uncharacterized membrane protein